MLCVMILLLSLKTLNFSAMTMARRYSTETLARFGLGRDKDVGIFRVCLVIRSVVWLAEN